MVTNHDQPSCHVLFGDQSGNGIISQGTRSAVLSHWALGQLEYHQYENRSLLSRWRSLGQYIFMKTPQNIISNFLSYRDLVNGYNIRCNNHSELLACLKIVNQVKAAFKLFFLNL